MKCLSVETICCKIMRKCTGPGTEADWLGQVPLTVRPRPLPAKCLELWTYTAYTALVRGTGAWWPVTRPGAHLIGLVVEKIKRLLGPSLSRIIAPFFRFAILLTLLGRPWPWLGPGRGSLTQTHQHRSKIMQQYFFTYNLFAKSAGPEHPPPWINHFLAQYCASFI